MRTWIIEALFAIEMFALAGLIDDILSIFQRTLLQFRDSHTGTQDADEKTDRDHWGKFPSFREYSDDMRLTRGPLDHRRNPHVFMRWKVRLISCAPSHRAAA